MTVAAAAADDDGGNSFVSFLLQIFGPIPPHFRSRKSSLSSVRIEEEEEEEVLWWMYTE